MEPARRGLLLLTMLGALCACDRPQEVVAAPIPAPEPPEMRLSEQQVQQRAMQCETKALARFKADSKQATAEFAHHYHRKRDTCFYLIAVSHQETRHRKLLDINEHETYGEFIGFISDESLEKRKLPDLCHVDALYCASEGEWEVLVRQFMQD